MGIFFSKRSTRVFGIYWNENLLLNDFPKMFQQTCMNIIDFGCFCGFICDASNYDPICDRIGLAKQSNVETLHQVAWKKKTALVCELSVGLLVNYNLSGSHKGSIPHITFLYFLQCFLRVGTFTRWHSLQFSSAIIQTSVFSIRFNVLIIFFSGPQQFVDHVIVSQLWLVPNCSGVMNSVS